MKAHNLQLVMLQATIKNIIIISVCDPEKRSIVMVEEFYSAADVLLVCTG